MSPTRTQDERDAITIEIVFALVSAVFMGVIVFLGLGSPVLWAELPRAAWEGPWLTASGCLGLAVFVVRVWWVLRRHRRPGLPGRQPSQPGRTNPDS
ncbi:DUF6332 family protein [Streptomyces halobius]|uniref:DUF6332 family protein n=1 Tax=Streptomyces halobius TaxID=2879846 RepID=A0ABY4MFX1_9ACTN|nr:DUF6332 family protein [Streptomyces halobius]UQA96696.1 DUF6332 family protein [Streptomyces halobius]